MKRKGIFTILTAAFMVLAFSAMALAADQAFIKTTVPNIPKSTCWQAGTDTMEWDTLTTMAEGDVITFTLNNRVTVCKALDYFVTFAATNSGVLDLTGNLPVSTTAGSINAPGALLQWGLLVQAPAGSQIITLTLRKIISATGVLNVLTPANRVTFTGTALTDKLVIKLFDGKGVATFATSGIQKYNATTVAYDTAIVAADNTLCIDTLTQDYLGEYVVNTPNSVPGLFADKLNFSGDYTIAHIMTAVSYSPVTCKGVQCGNIVLGSSTQTTSCISFDYETIGTGANGYCTTHTALAGTVPKIILQSSAPFEVTTYGITADILVNGSLAAKGVYWSNAAPAYNASATSQCGALGAPATAALPGAITYTYADGTSALIAPRAPGAYDCTITAVQKATRWQMAAAAGLFAAGQYYLQIDLPAFVYNLAEINAGDAVTIRLTLTKGTCGSVTQDFCIGTFGCPAGPAAVGAARFCPYVPSLAAGDTYWSGIAVVNNGTTAETVTLTAVKSDGSANATYTIPTAIPAGGMYVKLVSAIPWVGTTPAGIPAYIQVQAAATTPVGAIDAFVMMADGTHNSMGYLCR